MISVRIVYNKYQIFERPPKRDVHFLLLTSIDSNRRPSRGRRDVSQLSHLVLFVMCVCLNELSCIVQIFSNMHWPIHNMCTYIKSSFHYIEAKRHKTWRLSIYLSLSYEKIKKINRIQTVYNFSTCRPVKKNRAIKANDGIDPDCRWRHLWGACEYDRYCIC